MKMKKVEIEIPEDMEVELVRDHTAPFSGEKALVVHLKQRKTKELHFVEIPNRTHVNVGEYWATKANPHNLIQGSSAYNLEHGETVYKLMRNDDE